MKKTGDMIIHNGTACFYLDIRAEMMPDDKPDRSDVTKFDSSKLKHVETKEKIVMPSKEGIVVVAA